MGKLTDIQIKAWIKAGTRFEGKSDGSRENELTLKLLLVTCVRKMELCAARWSEFDLANGIWYLPGERTKTGDGIDIPLPKQAIEWLEELRLLSCNSKWVLPARKQQHRMIPHIQESTLPVALAKVKHEMPGVSG